MGPTLSKMLENSFSHCKKIIQWNVRALTLSATLLVLYIFATVDFGGQNFYSTFALLAMQSAVLARGILSVRPSVRPSRSGIVSRRMKIRSCGFQHLVGQSL